MTLMKLPLAALALFALAAPAAAQGGPAIAYATANLNMRAGPGTNYPVITTLPQGGGVTVFGCTANFAWCDAAFSNVKGWVSGKYLSYGGQGAYYGRPIPHSAPYIGVPRYQNNYPVYRQPPPVYRPAPPVYRPVPPRYRY